MTFKRKIGRTNRMKLLIKLIIPLSIWPFIAEAGIFPSPTPGSGQWGATQRCGHEYLTAKQIIDADKKVKRAKKAKEKLKKKVKSLEDDLKAIEKDKKAFEKDIKNALKRGVGEQVIEHLRLGGDDSSLEYKSCGKSLPARCKMDSSGGSGGSTPDSPDKIRTDLLSAGGGSSVSSDGGPYILNKDVCLELTQSEAKATFQASVSGNIQSDKLLEGEKCVNLWYAYSSGEKDLKDICDDSLLRRKGKRKRAKIRLCEKAIGKYADVRAKFDEAKKRVS